MAAARMLLLLALALAIASSAAFFQGTPLVGGAGRAAAASSLRSLSMVKVGEMAPDFIAKDQSGKDFKLSTLKGKKSVVLFFYPKDSTPGCTKEACSFNDNLSAFRKKGVEIVGVSSDADHSKFISQYDLGMTLLADVGGKLRTQYAVPKAAFGLLDGRVTYFIDKTGKVLGIYDNLTDAEGHVTKAKETFGV